MMKRKLTRATKIAYALFAGLISLLFCGMAYAAMDNVNRAPEKIPLPAGSVVYDASFVPTQLSEPGLVTRGKDGRYALDTGFETYALGAHTMAHTGAASMFFGGGYMLLPDGTVSAIEDGAEYAGFTDGALFNLADRRYAVMAPRIGDAGGTFGADDYLYIVMDIVGNAQM